MYVEGGSRKQKKEIEEHFAVVMSLSNNLFYFTSTRA